MRLGKEIRTAYTAMALCLVGACFARWWGHTHLYSQTEAIDTALYMCLFLVWMRSLRLRFIRREVAGCLMAIAALMLVWRFLQLVKYGIVTEMPAAERWTWYAFYVPILFMPAFFFIAMLHVGRPESWRAGRAWWLLAGAGLLSALVLTNDLHQLAFRFSIPLGLAAEYADGSNYTHGPVFFVAWGWIILLGMLSVAVLIKRSVRADSLRRAIVPVSIAIAMAVLVPGVDSQKFPTLFMLFSFSEMTCILMLAFAESMLVLGFFPTNAGYEALWRASSLRGGFVDGEGRLCDLSASAPSVTAEQASHALAQPMLLDDGVSELVAVPVTGGTAFWVRDQRVVRALAERFEDLGDDLVQEQEMLNSELELARNREALAHRQELFEQVFAATEGQLDALEAELAAMPDDEDAFLARMRIAAVYAVYIKRCANLTFIGARGFMDVRELSLAFEETCSCLNALGADATVSIPALGNVRSDAALNAYAAFERLVEDALPHVAEACVEGEAEGDSLVVRLAVRGDGDKGGGGTLSCTLPLAGDAA